ncbi:hypothetical protein [Serratia sp. Je.1.23.a]|uniref:hypothetical protein n=1 Tax=Serratia sp. Je.1.23.a TaxID=3142841 RepID=UPI003DA85752
MEQEYSKKNKAKPADDVDAVANALARVSVSGGSISQGGQQSSVDSSTQSVKNVSSTNQPSLDESVKIDVDNFLNHKYADKVIKDYCESRHASIRLYVEKFLHLSYPEQEYESYVQHSASAIMKVIEKKSAQDKLMSDPTFKLTDDERKYVQRFYSTNAGALFINTRARNLYLVKPLPVVYETVDKAIAAGAGEKGTDGASLLPQYMREKLKSAFGKGDPLAVMRASLAGGTNIYSEYQYRGTRLSEVTLKNYKAGDVLKNVAFLSFSPDITDGKYHHKGKKTARDFFGKYSGHSGVPVLYELSPRSQVSAIKISSANEHETVIAPGNYFEIFSIKKEPDCWVIQLVNAPKKISSCKIMFN